MSSALERPDADCWLMVNGHRWVTDGACLLREDCPALPTKHDPENGYPRWKKAQEVSTEEIAARLRAFPVYYNEQMRFHPRFAPVLQTTHRAWESMHRLFNGEVVAIVMPMASWVTDCPTVDDWGRP